MDKLEGKSLDLESKNIEEIKRLFPNVVTEGKIDFDKLRLLLGDEVDDSMEKYQFTWKGKSQSIKLAQSPSTATLRPAKEESKNWDTTENLYIEGDNLEVLKQLQKTYFGKIKMIYIDPPYNTGGDFVYKDDFKDSIKNYKEQTNQTRKSNPETSGRYHTDWLNMMYSRLILAKSLLKDDGVIFISIDDNEFFNLKKISDEILGENNFITDFIWKSKNGGGNDAKQVAIDKEYIICYAKNISNIKQFYDLDYKTSIQYNNKDKNGEYTLERLDKKALGYIKSLDFAIYDNEGNKYLPEQPDSENPSARWRWNEDKVKENINMLVFKNGYVYTKVYKKEGAVARDLLIDTRYKRSQDGTKDVKKIFGSKAYFSFPKPTDLIKHLVKIYSYGNSNASEDFIILDFFSGSATTAHAVMKLNAEDGGNRKFIMVQLPEKTDEKSEAYKAGYKNICEIGKERIRRAGEQIKQELIEKKQKAGLLTEDIVDPEKLDIGFKVFKLDETNIKPWDSSQEVNENTLLSQIEIIKPDRTKEDVLYEILLKYGVFNESVKEIKLNGNTAYSVSDNYMIVYLSENISKKDIKAIADEKPKVVIFLENGFTDDNQKINAVATLKHQGVEDVKCI